MNQLQIIRVNKNSKTFTSYDYQTDKSTTVIKVEYSGRHTIFIPKSFVNNDESISIYKAYANKIINDRNDLLNFEINSKLKFDIFDVFEHNVSGALKYQTSQSLVRKLFSILREKERKTF